jgi:hypothetical protein
MPLNPPDLSRATWLWPGHAVTDPVNIYAQFRREFVLPKRTPKATVQASADQEYQLYINGRYVARGPARGYPASWPIDEIDVSEFLREGHNVVAAIVHHPGIGTFRYRCESKAGFIFALRAGDFELNTDESWLCRHDPGRARVTGKLSKQMGFQEQADLRQDNRAWLTQPDTELTPGWIAPSTTIYGSAPWHTMESRQLPMLTRDIAPYKKAVGHASFITSVQETGGHLIRPTDLHRSLINAAEWSRLDSSAHEGSDGLLHTPAVAERESWAITLDYGRPTVGELLLDIRNPRGGEALDVLFAEAVDQNGRPILPDTKGGNAMDMATRVVLAQERCRHEAFQVIGHRYATLVVNGPCPALEINASHRETRYPLDRRGDSKCDDLLLQAIYDVSVNTQLNCMLDAYVDTPWREQAQWWGDARVQAWNTFYLANDPRLLRRGIRQIGDPAQEVPNGLTYGHAPTIAHDCILPDFGCVWILTIWDDYFQTGDLKLFREMWPRIQRLLGYFEAFGIAEGNLVSADPRYWLFLDWTEGIPREGQPALLNMLLLEALQQLSQLLKLESMPGGDRVQKLATTLGASVERAYWDPGRECFRDGIDSEGESCGLHTQVQAILCGLRPSAHADLAGRFIEPFLVGDSEPEAQPTPYWMTYVYEAARRQGLVAQTIRHLRRHWQPMAEQGGTWERFVPPGTSHSSGSHAWSAHPIHHLPRMLGGIVPTAAAWRTIDFRPCLEIAEIGQYACTVPTPQGDIKTQWKRTGNHTQVELSLPEGIEAQVDLPGRPNESVRDRQTWTVSPPSS